MKKRLMSAVILICLGLLASCGYSPSPSTAGEPPSQLTATAQPTSPGVSFKVTSVAMAVSPASIAGLRCGTPVTVTYTATFHVASGSMGGVVTFGSTVTNGRGGGDATHRLTFGPGVSTKTFSFLWSGALPADHTSPGRGGVQVSSPNQLISPLVAPTGQCRSSSATFQVTSVTMAVNPTSIQGLSCGTSVVVTYTATIHVAANGPGGTVKFSTTVNNGRANTPASITFSPGQTVRTSSFTWSGALPGDHTSPGRGGIQVSSPNQLISPMVQPGGMCQ